MIMQWINIKKKLMSWIYALQWHVKMYEEPIAHSKGYKCKNYRIKNKLNCPNSHTVGQFPYFIFLPNQNSSIIKKISKSIPIGFELFYTYICS